MVDHAGGPRRQLAELHRVGRSALRCFGHEGAPLRLLRHEHNTTFRVDSGGQRFVLRISRQGVHDRDTLAAEMAWLQALRNDTELGVPSPVRAVDGSSVVSIPDAAGVGRHQVVLLGWQQGGFVNARLAPRHLAQVAVLQAGLHRHSRDWVRPAGFTRPRVDTLTTAAKVRSLTRSPGGAETRPGRDDAEAAMSLVDELLSSADALVVGRALEVVWSTTRTLDALPNSSGLIHGDLHPENFLFDAGRARAIDFDDCGWGYFLYDLAVTLWELQQRTSYPQLREALLAEHSRHRPLPADVESHLDALMVLRRLQILLWILESRHHIAFADRWQRWAGEEMHDLTAAVESLS